MAGSFANKSWVYKLSLVERIEECISFLLGKAYQQVQQQAKARLAPYGVTPVQYALLWVLWEGDGRSGAELGERLQLDGATIVGILDRLEAAGLLERRPDAHDRRVNRIFLRPAGRELQGLLEREMDELNRELDARFSRQDAAKLRELLAEIGQVPIERVKERESR